MRIMLISAQLAKNDSLSEEIGLCSIASYLRSLGHHVMVEALVEDEGDYGELLEFNPDIIGATTYLHNVSFVDDIFRKFKAHNEKSLTIIGGYAATYYYNEILIKYQSIDIAVRGEGELVMAKIVAAYEKGQSCANIPSVCYRDGSKIIANDKHLLIKDINLLPYASRDILIKKRFNFSEITSSRGCMKSCSFCISSSFWGEGKCIWRGVDPSRIVDEIEKIVHNYGVKRFVFTDCSYEDPNVNRMIEIAGEIEKRNLSYIGLIVNMRPETVISIDDDCWKYLTKNGIVTVFLGVESGNAEDLSLYCKPTSVEVNLAAIKKLRKMDVNVTFGLININPYSTIERLENNL